jgi:hypothetical protein
MEWWQLRRAKMYRPHMHILRKEQQCPFLKFVLQASRGRERF